jgi:DNA-binding MarR family transcriptional regulator
MLTSKEGPCGSGSGSGSEAWSILAHLWQLLQAVLDESAPALEGMGLTTKAFLLLSSVEENPFPAELARRMHLPPPTVTYLVKQLEAGGLLERKSEPGDLRKFRLVVTESGRRAISCGQRAIGAALEARLARLAPEEIGPLDRVLERLARRVED